jgi:hypothetical protein
MFIFNILGLLFTLPAYGLGVVLAGVLWNEWHGYGPLPVFVAACWA